MIWVVKFINTWLELFNFRWFNYSDAVCWTSGEIWIVSKTSQEKKKSTVVSDSMIEKQSGCSVFQSPGWNTTRWLPHDCRWSLFYLLFWSQCIENIIGGTDYSQNQVNKWTASIVERCLAQLVKQGKAYKYIGRMASNRPQVEFRSGEVRLTVFVPTVTCAVMQKTGAGLHSANSCYWDTGVDGRRLSVAKSLSIDLFIPNKGSTARWFRRTCKCC